MVQCDRNFEHTAQALAQNAQFSLGSLLTENRCRNRINVMGGPLSLVSVGDVLLQVGTKLPKSEWATSSELASLRFYKY